jgi:Spy/CpxP family protein refolding chaperone
MNSKHAICPALLLALVLIAATAHAQTNETQSQRIDRLREEERAANLVSRTVPNANLNGPRTNGRAWWTNVDIVTQLGLTDEQKTKIERAFENHWRAIVANSGLLEKEEQQLARLLEAEAIDHSAVLIQTSRVIQARSETERETAVMTLEMREQLTRTQWTKLQAMETRMGRDSIRTQVPAPSTGVPGLRSRGQ